MTEIVSCMSNIASGTDLQVMLVFCGRCCYLEDGDDANSPGKAQGECYGLAAKTGHF